MYLIGLWFHGTVTSIRLEIPAEYGKTAWRVAGSPRRVTHARWRRRAGERRSQVKWREKKEKRIDEHGAQLGRKWTAVSAKAVKSVRTFTSGDYAAAARKFPARSPARARRFREGRPAAREGSLSWWPGDVNKNGNDDDGDRGSGRLYYGKTGAASRRHFCTPRERREFAPLFFLAILLNVRHRLCVSEK